MLAFFWKRKQVVLIVFWMQDHHHDHHDDKTVASRHFQNRFCPTIKHNDSQAKQFIALHINQGPWILETKEEIDTLMTSVKKKIHYFGFWWCTTRWLKQVSYLNSHFIWNLIWCLVSQVLLKLICQMIVLGKLMSYQCFSLSFQLTGSARH